MQVFIEIKKSTSFKIYKIYTYKTFDITIMRKFYSFIFFDIYIFYVNRRHFYMFEIFTMKNL